MKIQTLKTEGHSKEIMCPNFLSNQLFFKKNFIEDLKIKERQYQVIQIPSS